MDNIENTMRACKKRCENNCNWKRSKCNLIFNNKHYEFATFQEELCNIFCVPWQPCTKNVKNRMH